MSYRARPAARVVCLFLSGALAGSSVGCTARAVSTYDAGSFGALPPDAGPAVDAGPRPDPGPRLDDVLVYAHSDDTLFTFSPYSNEVTEVGLFTLPGGGNAPDMIDLAVNADGEVYTASFDSLYRIDPTTAVATEVGELDVAGERFFALTFLAAGMIRPAETLIGATNEGVYYEIDPLDASTARLGRYPDGWISSGDIVSVGGRAYATLKDPNALDAPDVLAQITFDSSGRSSVRVLGSTGYRQLFGLGSWGDSLYGFSNAGQLVALDPTTGAGRIATEMTGTDRFWGAGVTTQVPILF